MAIFGYYIWHFHEWFLRIGSGLAVITLGAAITNPARSPYAWLFAGWYAFVVAIAFLLVARLNQRAAGRLQRQIDELNAAEKLLPRISD